jgi:hypothetical protein
MVYVEQNKLVENSMEGVKCLLEMADNAELPSFS